MTATLPTDSPPLTREYHGQPVRIFMCENAPWFEATAICAAMGIAPATVESFNRKALDTDIALHAFDDAPVYVLSPIGAWKLGEDVDAYRCAKVSAWAKRQAAELVPEATPNDPRMFVTLTPDGRLPLRPAKYSGRLAEWDNLRCSPAGIAARVKERSIIPELRLRRASLAAQSAAR